MGSNAPANPWRFPLKLASELTLVRHGTSSPARERHGRRIETVCWSGSTGVLRGKRAPWAGFHDGMYFSAASAWLGAIAPTRLPSATAQRSRARWCSFLVSHSFCCPRPAGESGPQFPPRTRAWDQLIIFLMLAWPAASFCLSGGEPNEWRSSREQTWRAAAMLPLPPLAKPVFA